MKCILKLCQNSVSLLTLSALPAHVISLGRNNGLPPLGAQAVSVQVGSHAPFHSIFQSCFSFVQIILAKVCSISIVSIL